MLDTNRCDLIVMEILFTCIILEFLWTVYFVETLEYRSSFLTFFTVDLPKFEPKIDEQMRQILIKFQAIVNFIVTGVYLNLIILIACFSVLVPLISCLPSYNEQCTKNLLQWLVHLQWQSKFKRYSQIRQSIKTNLFIQSMTYNRLGFTCGPLFYINKYKFFELLMLNIPWILLFYKQISLLINNSHKLSNIVRKISWIRFHKEYIVLYSILARLNQSAMYILFDLEIVNKASAMFACVFYSKQDKMGLNNTSFTLILIFYVLSANLMYHQIATLPEYNAKYKT
uniref:Uncharacterized protein LOC113788522 n=1 Tax=Dermatophagoides pteronyssinus TaxID=6956 RepID=A0A6P6XK61_DERPT|nr:uncharacterized protein LOC113788522 [Dermatophagoides pteronyssinus]